MEESEIEEARLMAILEIAESFSPSEDGMLSEKTKAAIQAILATPVEVRGQAFSQDDLKPEETDAIVIDMAGEGDSAGGSGGANVDFDRPSKGKEKAKAKRLRGRRLSRRKDFKKIKSKFSRKGDE